MDVLEMTFPHRIAVPAAGWLFSSGVRGGIVFGLVFLWAHVLGALSRPYLIDDYAYGAGATGPHAVTAADGYTITYDANGNLLTRTRPGESWTFAWTGWDKPWLMAKEGAGREFRYGPGLSLGWKEHFHDYTNV